VIKPILGATWTAVLIVASQAPVGVWWIGPVSLVPWLMTSRTLNSLVFTGLLWGTLSGVGMGHWIAKGLVNVGATPAQGILGTVGCALVITGGALRASGTERPRKPPGVL
jgi:hypothetical protein